MTGTGVAVPRRVNEFRVNKLQSMNVNSWRMSHNPPNPDLLETTDRTGIMGINYAYYILLHILNT